MSLTSVIRSYQGLSPLKRSLLFSFLLVLPVLLTAVISYYVRASLEKTFQVQLIAVVVLFSLFSMFRRYVELKMETLDRVTEAQRNALGQGYATLDAIVARRTKDLHAAFNEYKQKAEPKPLFEATLASLGHIQSLIESLYDVLQSQFGRIGSLLQAIEFEVTFMTKSYVDGKITVYAYQNRDNRAPLSLLLREKNSDIYDCTVTAEIYRETRPEMHVIEDTAKHAYAEVYPGQKERIKSSIVYPVLSDANELLGTIVMHCNQSGFFRTAEAGFWRMLLEMYAKRTAYEKMCLDLLTSIDFPNWAGGINATGVRPNR